MPLQNSLNDLKPAIVAKTCENERRITPRIYILLAEPGLKVLKHTVIAKGDNLLGDVKLFPHSRSALELLDQVASRLASMLGGLAKN